MKTGILVPVMALAMAVPPAFAAHPFASSDSDRRAKQAVPAPGKSLIYVYRGSDKGPAESDVVLMNGHAIRTLVKKSYIYRASGRGRLSIQAAESSPIAVQIEPGRIYFVRLLVSAAGDHELKVVSYGVGRRDMHGAGLLVEDKNAVAKKPRPASKAKKEARKPAKPAAARSTSDDDGHFNLVLKGGLFSLASTRQNIDAAAGGATVTFSTSFDGSAGLYGLEGEWIFRSGWAFGGELTNHQHSYTTVPAGATGSGDMQLTTVAANLKKYFRTESVVQPFVGAGLGVVNATLSGELKGTSTGFVIQAISGVAFRWEHVGLYTELKYQFAETADVSASGLGVLAGFGVQF